MWHHTRAWRLEHSRAMKGNKNWLGKHHSTATKLKLARLRLGKPSYNKGNHYSKAQRERISKSHLGVLLGKKHWNWKGGTSFEPYPSTFNGALKREIQERDNYTCQLCGERDNIVHHIDYDKQNNNPSNLCVLCARCHSKTNYNRSYYIRLFRKILCMFFFVPTQIT